MTEPLTIGQQLAADWHERMRDAASGLSSSPSETELAEAIDAAVAAEREACARIADTGMLVPPDGGSPTQDEIDVAENIAAAIRNRK